MTSYLPDAYGLLPIWLFWVDESPRCKCLADSPKVSIISAANSVQAYITTRFTSRVYSPSAVNPLSSRTFGTWTFVSSVIRMYAAYNISDPLIYHLTLWTFGIALAHFSSEWLYFGSTKLDKGLLPSMLVATGSLTWMLLQWEFYSMGGWTIRVSESSSYAAT